MPTRRNGRPWKYWRRLILHSESRSRANQLSLSLDFSHVPCLSLRFIEKGEALLSSCAFTQHNVDFASFARYLEDKFAEDEETEIAKEIARESAREDGAIEQ